MSTNLKPATAKARLLLKKLQALAERGVDGERFSAQQKLARLKTRFDFTAADPAETPDLFSGRFARASKARRIWSFDSSEFDVANCVKWAIESTTRIACCYRDCDLLAGATPGTAKKLTKIAVHIADSFRVLINQFGAVDGVNVQDRCVFVMGLYDGMMNEVRKVGARLPSRGGVRAPRKSKKKAAPPAPSLNIHPYTIALSLGKRIRFSAPIQEIAAELEAVTQAALNSATP